MSKLLLEHLKQPPLIAILRGLTPNNALAVGQILIGAGFKMIEVPLNSPEPFSSIRLLTEKYSKHALIGAGTVMTPYDMHQVQQAGGQFVVMPHFNIEIVQAAKTKRLLCLPGIATPSEGFAALKAGADGLKLFPAELITPSVLKAMRAVFPKETLMILVGGITPDNMLSYWQAGASGFGLGSALFKPDYTIAQIAERAQQFVIASKMLSA